MRTCTKTGCSGQAVAACGFDYAAQRAWIGPLPREREPSAYDLCEVHAANLKVPKGWTLTDLRKERKPVPGPFEAAAAPPSSASEPDLRASALF